MKLSYIVWNPSKVAMHGRQTELAANTYAGLLEAESGTNSISSHITVNDEAQLQQFLTATYNETDVDLCYHLLIKET
jgi:hypothetical protein